MNHDALKVRHRAVRDRYPPDLNLRIHRALSWLKRAEMAEDDDGRFIFLWIAFNAPPMRARPTPHRSKESAHARSPFSRRFSLPALRLAHHVAAALRCALGSRSAAHPLSALRA